jgi:uncharacterized phage protein gp47/JayE
MATEFVPLYPEETEDVIAARWAAWANEGLDPSDEEYVDTEVGSMWWLLTRPGIREAARLYDLMGTEVVAAAFPQFAWGEFLDDHAEREGLTRNAAVAATGEVTFTGPSGTVIATGQTVFVPAPDVDSDPIEFTTTADVTIPGGGWVVAPIVASIAGSAGNVSGTAITGMSPPIASVAVSNTDPTEGGTDTEADEPLRVRVAGGFSGGAAANVAFYTRKALDFPGIGRVTVIPNASGLNTILLIVTTADGQPVSAGVVTGFQNEMDPVAGEGLGDAPAGVSVMVETPTLLNITVTATVEHEPGYSLAGSDGTITTSDAIKAAVGAYVRTVQSGTEVVQRQVVRAIVGVQGVHDVSVALSPGAGGNGNIPVPQGQVPNVGTWALSQGAV